MHKSFILLTAIALLANMPVEGATITTFTGGEPGEGLDLAGNFRYAVNISAAAPTLSVYGARFTRHGLTAGITGPGGSGAFGTAPIYGNSSSDNNLETIMSELQYANPLSLQMDVEVGKTYKLQLLFSENVFSSPGRYFDVVVEGSTIADEFETLLGGTWSGNPSNGVVITEFVTATSNSISVILGNGSTAGDHNAIFNAFTLEEELPGTLEVTTFTGAADLELLAENFVPVYSVNVSAGTASYSVNGLTFLSSGPVGTSVPKVTVASLQKSAGWGTKPNYGTTSDDNNLEDVMYSMYSSWPADNVSVDAEVTVGCTYTVRLLFSENGSGAISSRAFDIEVEGTRLENEFDINAITGGWTVEPTVGAMVAYTFVAGDANLDVDLRAGTTADGVPVFNGFTLSKLPSGTLISIR